MDNRIVTNLLEFDFLPEADRARIRRQQLVKLYHHAVRHPLVKDRVSPLAEVLAGEPIEAVWQQVPAVDAEDHGPYLRESPEFIGSLEESAWASIVFSSGGTTGRPKFTWLTFAEVMTNARFHGKGYGLAGINHTDCVATFGLPGYLSSEFTVYHGLRMTGCRILPIGSVESPAVVVDLIRALQANVLLVMPSDLLPLLDHLTASNDHLRGIRLVVTGGEALTPALQALIQTRVGDDHTQFRSTFQTSEAGTIGFQCPASEAGEYHVHDELQFVELAPCEGGRELVTTNLDRYLMPVIRLATGDLCEWVDGPCPCRRKSSRLRHLGRRPKHLKIGGEKTPLEQICNDLMRQLHAPASACAVEIDCLGSGKDLVRIKLDPTYSDPALASLFEAGLFAAAPKLAAQVRAGIVAPLAFEVLSPQDRCFSSTGKRILVKDVRAESTTC